MNNESNYNLATAIVFISFTFFNYVPICVNKVYYLTPIQELMYVMKQITFLLFNNNS